MASHHPHAVNNWTAINHCHIKDVSGGKGTAFNLTCGDKKSTDKMWVLEMRQFL